MLVRRKQFSGYEVLKGSNYHPAQVGIRIIDNVDSISDKMEEIPVVNKASKKWRDRIRKYTKPTKILIGNDNIKK